MPSPLIDIGGGMGALEIMVLTSSEKNKNIKFVIFDLEKTIEKSQEVWSSLSQYPQNFHRNFTQFWKHQPTGMRNNVSFVAGDFMENDPAQSKIPVPSKPEDTVTYIIRHVLHNWDDDDVPSLYHELPC